MKLYYHKTSGGAEYLTDRYIKNPDGSREGTIKNVRFVVRIDGNIRKDAELTVVDQPVKKKQVVISVKGGVADIAYTSPDVEVAIVDLDNAEAEGQDCEKLLKDRIAKAKKDEK